MLPPIITVQEPLLNWKFCSIGFPPLKNLTKEKYANELNDFVSMKTRGY